MSSSSAGCNFFMTDTTSLQRFRSCERVSEALSEKTALHSPQAAIYQLYNNIFNTYNVKIGIKRGNYYRENDQNVKKRKRVTPT
jgi:hypothetical protein